MFRYDRTKTHAEQIPFMRAAREEWEQEFLPKLKELHERQAAERDLVASLLSRGLTGIKATHAEIELVARLSGFPLAGRGVPE